MAEQRVQRRLTAFLAADVVGYSRLMGDDAAGPRTRFNAHLDNLIEPAIANRKGRIVKTTGDGILVEFSSVVDAVECAGEIQKGMTEWLENWKTKNYKVKGGGLRTNHDLWRELDTLNQKHQLGAIQANAIHTHRTGQRSFAYTTNSTHDLNLSAIPSGVGRVLIRHLY